MGESRPRLLSVCTHDRDQDSPMQTEQARLIRCLLHYKRRNQEQFNNILLANGDELNLILPKFARRFYFFFLFRLFGTFIDKYC